MASCYKQAGIKRRSVQTAVLMTPDRAPLHRTVQSEVSGLLTPELAQVGYLCPYCRKWPSLTRPVQATLLVATPLTPLKPGRSYDRGVGINPASSGPVNVITADQINHDSTVAVNSDSTDRICRVS